MTLIEILVVIVIFGLGWFAVLPNLDLAGGRSGRGELEQVNVLLGRARTSALELGQTQLVTSTLGEETLAWNDEQADLPSGISRATVNGLSPATPVFSCRFYPSGVSDALRLVLLDGTVLECRSLSGRFEAAR
jgi:prepilin-type N-terminal cleavage/methylation domain-containing protein